MYESNYKQYFGENKHKLFKFRKEYLLNKAAKENKTLRDFDAEMQQNKLLAMREHLEKYREHYYREDIDIETKHRKEYYKNNKEKIRAYQKEYRANNQKRIKGYYQDRKEAAAK